MKPMIMMKFSCMNNDWFCTEIDSLLMKNYATFHKGYFLFDL